VGKTDTLRRDFRQSARYYDCGSGCAAAPAVYQADDVSLRPALTGRPRRTTCRPLGRPNRPAAPSCRVPRAQDLKLSNVLIGMDGTVKVTDFGMSKELADSLALARSFKGTSTHMAPERIRHDTYSFPADVWSLGVCLLECATGRNPYAGHGTYIATCDAILSQDSPRALGATGAGGAALSESFDAFVGHCLCKDPARRVPADVLLAAPWLVEHGITSLSAARDRFRVWIELVSSRGVAAANAHAAVAAAEPAPPAEAAGGPGASASASVSSAAASGPAAGTFGGLL